MKRLITLIAAAGFFLMSCTTTESLDFPNEFIEETEDSSNEEENDFNEDGKDFLKENKDIKEEEKEIIYIERPVYIPEEKNETTKKSGIEAVAESLKAATKSPENYRSGTFYYTYNENFVYEIYAQPYHLTDIELEEGEVVTGTPLLSEDESVWELTAGVAKKRETGNDIQHLFIKPAYSKLNSTLIIITDRRVYHFCLKSFSDTYMAMVKFTYPEKINKWAEKTKENDKLKEKKDENKFIRISNPELLSFDYTVRYPKFRKPAFLPERVYDDGQYTYIHVNEIVLQKKLPVLFNDKNEIINYSVHGNVFVVPRLIDKVTLRLGKEKVSVLKEIKRNNNPGEKTD